MTRHNTSRLTCAQCREIRPQVCAETGQGPSSPGRHSVQRWCNRSASAGSGNWPGLSSRQESGHCSVTTNIMAISRRGVKLSPSI